MALDRTTLSVSIALPLAAIVYLLSPPFAFYLAIRFEWAPGPMNAMDTFYGPALWLSQHCPPYEHLLNAILAGLGINFKL